MGEWVLSTLVFPAYQLWQDGRFRLCFLAFLCALVVKISVSSPSTPASHGVVGSYGGGPLPAHSGGTSQPAQAVQGAAASQGNVYRPVKPPPLSPARPRDGARFPEPEPNKEAPPPFATY